MATFFGTDLCSLQHPTTSSVTTPCSKIGRCEVLRSTDGINGEFEIQHIYGSSGARGERLYGDAAAMSFMADVTMTSLLMEQVAILMEQAATGNGRPTLF